MTDSLSTPEIPGWTCQACRKHINRNMENLDNLTAEKLGANYWFEDINKNGFRCVRISRFLGYIDVCSQFRGIELTNDVEDQPLRCGAFDLQSYGDRSLPCIDV